MSTAPPSEEPTAGGAPGEAKPAENLDELELDLSSLKITNDVAQVPIASLTADTPLIPFRPNKRKVVPPPFRFLLLPSELRVKIYEYYFADDETVLDLGPDNYKRYHKLLGLMRVCRQISYEATHLFYSTRTFRIFPTHPARLKTKKPLLARLKPRQRECIATLDLRLGPGWNAPPRSWVVNDALGLKECVNAHQLNVLVQCDPSDGIFKGFRRSEGFYESFSRQLLESVIKELPALKVIEFDAWPGVQRSGAMMRGLLDLVAEHEIAIAWGPERGWTDAMEEDDRAAPLGSVIDVTQRSSFAAQSALAVA